MFTSALVFDCARFGLGTVRHSVVLPQGAASRLFPRTAVRLTEGCALRVESEAPLPEGARVSVTVSQCNT